MANFAPLLKCLSWHVVRHMLPSAMGDERVAKEVIEKCFSWHWLRNTFDLNVSKSEMARAILSKDMAEEVFTKAGMHYGITPSQLLSSDEVLEEEADARAETEEEDHEEEEKQQQQQQLLMLKTRCDEEAHIRDTQIRDLRQELCRRSIENGNMYQEMLQIQMRVNGQKEALKLENDDLRKRIALLEANIDDVQSSTMITHKNL
jgi:hypothetical protein